MDVAVVLIILQLIYLEGILSIDNAAVLGAMVAHLPRHERIPWPRPLRMFQKPTQAAGRSARGSPEGRPVWGLRRPRDDALHRLLGDSEPLAAPAGWVVSHQVG